MGKTPSSRNTLYNLAVQPAHLGGLSLSSYAIELKPEPNAEGRMLEIG